MATLSALNDDCLLLICGLLPIKDQLALLKLNGHFKAIILQIWSNIYKYEFDCSKERQFKLLSANEQNEFLTYISTLTNALLNLNTSGCRALNKRKRMCMPILPNICKLSIDLDVEDKTGSSFTTTAFGNDATELVSLPLLSQLPCICMNIVELRLQGAASSGGAGGAGLAGIKPTDVRLFFKQLHLTLFELLPVGAPITGCSQSIIDVSCWSDIKYCKSLETLKLPAYPVLLAAMEIAQLPRLQHITVFWQPQADIDDDDKRNEVTMATDAVATWLTKLAENSTGDCQIVGLHLQCQLNRQLLHILSTQGTSLCRLREFSWHSQLSVHYDPKVSCVKWIPQQPKLTHAMLQFISSQVDSLYELDFMQNVHATPSFLAIVYASLESRRVTVWHDGCPKMTILATKTKQNNDLAYMHFTLRNTNNKLF